MSDSFDFNDLSLATDEQLIEELRSRAQASPQHGMILVYGRPTEGMPSDSNGFVSIGAQSANLVKCLLEVLLQKFHVRGRADGKVAIPPITLIDGDAKVIEAEEPEVVEASDALPSYDFHSPEKLSHFLLLIPGVEQVATSDGGGLVCFVDRDDLHHILTEMGFVTVFQTADEDEHHYVYSLMQPTS